uniref:hypothetical protein n=1 Tax=Pseudomonas sp. RW407 TaxID=2202894 RepID=UPI0015ACF961|nr:hypothetical protein [Pseudomonas sp. RW407]
MVRYLPDPLQLLHGPDLETTEQKRGVFPGLVELQHIHSDGQFTNIDPYSVFGTQSLFLCAVFFTDNVNMTLLLPGSLICISGMDFLFSVFAGRFKDFF